MKTLIILDTNKLRSTTLGESSYGVFDLSSEFNSLNSFIKDKGLSDFVTIAIPSVAMQELLQQKVEQYFKDIRAISGIRSRLSEVPGADFAGVSLPETTFDCKEHLRPRMEEFVRTNNLAIMDIAEEKFSHVLEEVLRRAIERRPPFKRSKNHSDIGFKDVMIWESMLHFSHYNDYDRVILFTGDAGFDKECKHEFETIFKKELVITGSLQFLLTEMGEDFAPEIRTMEWRGFVEKDYFKSYFDDQVTKLKYVDFEGVDCKVIQVTVSRYLDDVEIPDADTSDFATVLVGLLKGTLEIDGKPRDVNIRARTFLDDAKDILGTEFNVE